MASSQGKSVALKGAGAMVKPDRSRPASWDVKLLCMVQFLLSNGEGTEEEVSRENACSPCPKKDREKGIAAPRQRGTCARQGWRGPHGPQPCAGCGGPCPVQGAGDQRKGGQGLGREMGR